MEDQVEVEEKEPEEKPKEEKKKVNVDDISGGEMFKSILVTVIAVIAVVLVFKFAVKPMLHQSKLGGNSTLQQSREEGYWHDRFGY